MNPWDIQPRESAQAFHAFVHYRDQGRGRSADVAYQIHSQQCSGRTPSAGGAQLRAPGRWDGWAVTWTWRERAEEWDRHLDRLVQKRREKEHQAMSARHAKLGRMMQDKGEVRVKGLTAKQLQKLAPAVAVKLMESGVKIERSAEGQPTDTLKVMQEGTVQVQHVDATEPDVEIDLKALSLEDLRTLEAILRKAAVTEASSKASPQQP